MKIVLNMLVRMWQSIKFTGFLCIVIYFNTESSIFYDKVKIYTSSLWHCYQLPGAHHQEPAITPCSCHSVFTDWSIYSWISLEFTSPQEPKWPMQSQARTNANMSTCSREVALFYPFLSVPMQTGIFLFRGKKKLKIDWSVKMPLHRLIMRVAGS